MAAAFNNSESGEDSVTDISSDSDSAGLELLEPDPKLLELVSKTSNFITSNLKSNKFIESKQYYNNCSTSDSDEAEAVFDSILSIEENMKLKACFDQSKLENRQNSNSYIKLASKIESGIDDSKKYFDLINNYKKKNPVQNLNKLAEEICKDSEILKNSIAVPDFERSDAAPSHQESRRSLKKQRRLEREKTKGKNWFGLPATEMTEESKNDLMVLQMRQSLFPKRFYKHNDLKALPKYFQVGTVVEPSADFYHARIPKKQRKQTLVEELLADTDLREYNKRKYAELNQKEPWKRGAYRHMKRLKKKNK